MLKNNKRLHLEVLQERLEPLFDNLNSKYKNELRFTTKEASSFLGITPNALRIKVHRGQITAEKLDKKLRFKFSSLLSSFKKMEV